MNLSKEDLELQRDKLKEIVRHNMKTESIDEMEALLEAEEGIKTYKSTDGKSDIKIKTWGDTAKERTMSSMASYSGLTNEAIEKLLPEAYIELKKDITRDLALLLTEAYNPERESTIDFSREFGEAFKLDIVNESFADALDKLKEKKKQENNSKGIKSDDIRTINNGNGELSLVNVNHDKYAALAGFDTTEQFKASAEKLITHQNTSEFTTGNLSPFRDMNALISTFESEKIDFKMLQLASELDYLQELSMDSSVNPDYYTNLISKAEELGIVQPDGQGIEQLFNFIYKVQPIRENIGTDRSVKLARTPKEAGREVDTKSAESQYFAANTAVRTLDELVLTIEDLPSGDLLGTPMAVASIFERVTGTVKGLKTLISKVENTQVTGTFTQGAKDAFLRGLSKIDDTPLGLTGELSVANAKIEYLKFSLAYQMSMALQGGTGGRTISDQDVENMLRALNMNHLFEMQDEKQVLSSLATIRSFMVGISAKAYYQQLGDIKGYRTTAHVIGLMNALNMNKLNKLANEMEEKYGYPLGGTEHVTSSEAISIGITDWNNPPVNPDTNLPEWQVWIHESGHPYVSLLGGESYFMTQEMLSNYKATTRGQARTEIPNTVPEGVPPEGLTGLGGIPILRFTGN